MTKLMNKIVMLNNRRTSMRLCFKEWEALYEICKIEHISKNHLIEMIEAHKDNRLGLTYYTRLFLMSYFREAASEEGHKKAGHGIAENYASINQVLKNLYDDTEKKASDD